MDKLRLGPDDWMRAARRALLQGGPAAVRVETLASKLKVTKGSFYWHFRDRAELLDAILREWEDETEQFARVDSQADVRAAVESLIAEIGRRIVASERGDAPSDAAIFAWSAVSPGVARRVARVEEERLALLERLVGSRQRAELAYLCYLGFIDRRRRVRGMSEHFGEVMNQMFTLLSREPGIVHANARRRTA